jgi:DNA-binding transcriptional LysR family regulator
MESMEVCMAVKRALRKDRVAAPSVTQLESFVALVRYGKQAAVQAAVGRSQSQVSRDLSGLERALGARLLDRTTRKPTPAGEVLLAYAEQVQEGWAVAREKLGGESEVEGTVTLVAPCEVHEALLVPLLSRLGTRWEGLRILTAVAGPAEGAEMLRSGAADIGVLPLDSCQGVNTRPLCTARLYAAVAAAGDWAARRSVPVHPGPEEVVLLGHPQTGSLGELFKRVLGRASERTARVGSLGGGRQTLLDAAAAQLGVAWLLLFEESGDPLARTLSAQVVLKPISGAPARVPFSVAVRKGRSPGGPVEFVLREVLRHFRNF